MSFFLFKAHILWWGLGDTKVLAAVYGPKAGTKKNEDPEKACFEVIWKPKTGQIGLFLVLVVNELAFNVVLLSKSCGDLMHVLGKPEREFEIILKRTLQSICILTVNPNTTTSIIIQVM